MIIDYENIDLNDKETWDLLCTGKVKGCFQLDKTARPWLKKIRPRNILELAALISLIRPGCMNAIMDGKSMTQHYLDRKNGEYALPIHPSLEPILRETHQIVVYQEQTLEIAKQVAGFVLSKADILRKAMGKKDAKLMASLNEDFVKGCLEVGKVETKEDVQKIFDIIEKSNRYSFNKSHAVSYAFMGYWSAYAKVHCQRSFFCSWLKHGKDKLNPTLEIVQLVNDARAYGYKVLPPALYTLEKEFFIDTEINGIRFGLCEVKSVGEKQLEKLLRSVKGHDLRNISWFDFLIRFGIPCHINKNSLIALISVGALDYMGTNTRQQKLLEYSVWNKLTAKEQEWIKTRSGIKPEMPASQTKVALNKYHDELQAYESFKDSPTRFLSLIFAVTYMSKNRDSGRRQKTIEDLQNTLANPPFSTSDNVKWMMSEEKKLLGLPLTTATTEGTSKYAGSTTCDMFDKDPDGNMSILAEISEEREYKIKKGDNKGKAMCFLSITDYTSALDNVVIFSRAYEQYAHLLYVGNTVLLDGFKEDGSFKVNKVLQA